MTLLNIEKQDHYSNDYKELVGLAKQMVLQYTEEGMLSGKYNATGSIFTLKNNFGYVDIHHSVEIPKPANTLEARRTRVLEIKAQHPQIDNTN